MARLTIVAVLIDLRVWVNLHGGAARHLRDPALHGGAQCQVVVLVDAFELLPDGQLLIPWQKGHLGLSCELPPYGEEGRTFRPWPWMNFGFLPPVTAEVMRGESSWTE